MCVVIRNVKSGKRSVIIRFSKRVAHRHLVPHPVLAPPEHPVVLQAFLNIHSLEHIRLVVIEFVMFGLLNSDCRVVNFAYSFDLISKEWLTVIGLHFPFNNDIWQWWGVILQGNKQRSYPWWCGFSPRHIFEEMSQQTAFFLSSLFRILG